MATYNSNEWDKWMAAALAGDRDAYRRLLQQLREWLVAYFTNRVHPSVVEDLVQDTLLSLHNKRHTYDQAQPFGPWISAIARHRWIDHMRKRLKYIELTLDDADLPATQDADVTAKHDIQKLLTLLPPQQAEVIELVKIRDMSTEEVSQKTGHSVASIKVMIHRGIKKMRASIEKLSTEELANE